MTSTHSGGTSGAGRTGEVATPSELSDRSEGTDTPDSNHPDISTIDAIRANNQPQTATQDGRYRQQRAEPGRGQAALWNETTDDIERNHPNSTGAHARDGPDP